MKKTYISPELYTVKINSYTLLSGSITVSTEDAESDALSREFDYDDEWED